MKSFQFERPNPHKPSVSQRFDGGMWWATVITSDGRLITNCFFTHAEAIVRANELAAMNQEAAK